MNNTILSAKNSFQEGLIMDFSPEQTQAGCLTNALNATLLTFNGNEMALQNDMGNARVETAFLPEGYIPVGTCEFGDIIYVVSYNPLKNLSQIGCFPSPERNISSLESDDAVPPTLSCTDFQNGKMDNEEFIPDGTLKTTTVKKVLIASKLNPGDKYIIYNTLEGKNENGIVNNNIINNKEWLSNYNHSGKGHVALHVVSISDDGKIEYLDTTTKWYTLKDSEEYFISDKKISETASDLDEYRSLVCSNWSIFNSKVSGKLAILAELETINSFSCQYIVDDVNDIETQALDTNIKRRVYNINLHYQIDADPEIAAKYLIVPSIKWKTDQEGNFQLDEKWIDCGDYYYTIPVKSVSGDIKTEIPFGTFVIPLSETNTLDGDYTCEFDVIPAMSFGKLDYLKIPINIKFNSIYSGNSELTVWRYHNLGNTCTLQYGTEVYSKPGWETKYVKIEFYDNQGLVGEYLNDDSKAYNGIFTEYLNLGESSTNYRFSKIKYDKEIIGHPGLEIESTEEKPESIETTEEFIWKETNDSKGKITYTKYTNDAGTLYPNFLYLAKITIEQTKINKTDSKTDTYYRWLWTNAMFNEYYTSELDFKILPFVLNLTGSAAFEAKPNYAWNVEEDNRLNADTIEGSESYKVNKIEGSNINMFVTPGIENNYDCFQLNKDALQNLVVNIEVGKTKMQYSSPMDAFVFSQQNSALPKEVKSYMNSSLDEASFKLSETTKTEYNLSEYHFISDNDKKSIEISLDAELYTKFMINDINSTYINIPVYSPIIDNLEDLNKLGIVKITNSNGTFLGFKSAMALSINHDQATSVILNQNVNTLDFTSAPSDDVDHKYTSGNKNINTSSDQEFINNCWDPFKNSVQGDLFMVYLGGNEDYWFKLFDDLYANNKVNFKDWVNYRVGYDKPGDIEAKLFTDAEEKYVQFRQFDIDKATYNISEDAPAVGFLAIKNDSGYTLLNAATYTETTSDNGGIKQINTNSTIVPNLAYLIFLLFSRIYHNNKQEANSELPLKNYIKHQPYQVTISSDIAMVISPKSEDLNDTITLHGIAYGDYINEVLGKISNPDESLESQAKLQLTAGGVINQLSITQDSLEIDFPDLSDMAYFKFGDKYILGDMIPDNMFYINYQDKITPYLDQPYYFTSDEITTIWKNILNSEHSFKTHYQGISSISGNEVLYTLYLLLTNIYVQMETQTFNASSIDAAKACVIDRLMELVKSEAGIPTNNNLYGYKGILQFRQLLDLWTELGFYDSDRQNFNYSKFYVITSTDTNYTIYNLLEETISVTNELNEYGQPDNNIWSFSGYFNASKLYPYLNKVLETTDEKCVIVTPNLRLQDNFKYDNGLKLNNSGYFEYFGVASYDEKYGMTHFIKNAVLDTKYQIIP